MDRPITPQSALDADACYLALKAHDARFDGSFFTAVTSTGIYCRPVCRVKTPRRENCRFFQHAAQAEAAGFRPCLRCRPELAPRSGNWTTQDATRTLALQAARLIDEPDTWSSSSGSDDDGPVTARIAQRLGVSDRHLRRLFEKHLGVSPLQYLQTRRLLAAKQLIADTQLPMAQVALASGFASVRRFNAAFTEHYGLNPTTLRRSGADDTSQGNGQSVRVRIGLRPPYDVALMMNFFARRALGGIETVQGDGSARAPMAFARTLRIIQGGAEHTGWLRLKFDEAHEQALLDVSPSLASVLPVVISRSRALFDLDADPLSINAVLHDAFPTGDGIRVPGTVEGFELAVRAVLGQQVTVAAARTFGTRLVQAFGEPLATPVPGLDRLFPTPEALAQADADALGQLGIVRQRQAALQALAREVAAGRLTLKAGAALEATLAALQALPGIGAWTAQYIAMRALRWPDAFPAGDVALQKALGVGNARAAEQASHTWKPWRSYAVLRAWHGTAASATACVHTGETT